VAISSGSAPRPRREECDEAGSIAATPAVDHDATGGGSRYGGHRRGAPLRLALKERTIVQGRAELGAARPISPERCIGEVVQRERA